MYWTVENNTPKSKDNHSGPHSWNNNLGTLVDGVLRSLPQSVQVGPEKDQWYWHRAWPDQSHRMGKEISVEWEHRKFHLLGIRKQDGFRRTTMNKQGRCSLPNRWHWPPFSDYQSCPFSGTVNMPRLFKRLKTWCFRFVNVSVFVEAC